MKNLILYGLLLMCPFYSISQVGNPDADTDVLFWKHVSLTSEKAKLLPKTTSKFPVWIPITVGTAGVITGAFILLSEKKEGLILPKANDEEYIIMCGMNTEINPLANDTGEDIRITSFNGAPTGVNLLNGTTFTISNEVNQSFTIHYTITDKNGNTASAKIGVEIHFPELTVSNQNRDIVSGEILSGNILTNSICPECNVTNVTIPPGSVILTWMPDGNFNLRIDNLGDSTASYNFKFNITGKCGITTSAMLTVNVMPKECNISLITEQTPAHCDMNDGMISVDDIGGDFNFKWSNGSSSNILSGVPAGTYTLVISSLNLSCTQRFIFIVEEKEAIYFTEIITTPGNCYQSGGINIEIEGLTPGPLVITASGPLGNFSFETGPGLTDLAKLIENAADGKPVTGQYNISVRDIQKDERCTQRASVTIPVEPVLFSLKDDEYTTNQNDTLTGNVFTNDEGTGLSISEFNQIPGATLDMERNGQFTFKGVEGTYRYFYTARDTCGRLDTAMLIINVSLIICDYQVSFTTTPTICGGSTGTITTTIFPDDPVTLTWSNGATGSTIVNLQAGTYSLTITHPTGACQQTFSTVVTTTKVPYVTTSRVIQENCFTNPDIELNLIGPLSGFLNIFAIGPDSEHLFSVPDGNTLLSHFVPLTAGIWTLYINDLSASPDCAQQYTFELLPYLPPVLTLLDFEPPSSPTAKDGVIFVDISGGSPRYSITGPDMIYTNLLPGFNVLEGFPSGVFSLFAVDSLGCKSNIIIVEMFGNNNKPAPKITLSFTPFLPVLLAPSADIEHPDNTDAKHTIIALQSIMTTFVNGDNYISIGAGRNMFLRSDHDINSGDNQLNVFMFEAGRQWAVKNFYTRGGFRFQHQNVLSEGKSMNPGNGNNMCNFSLMSGITLFKNLNIQFFMDWYPGQGLLTGGNTFKYLF